jgi:hypothetical protein
MTRNPKKQPKRTTSTHAGAEAAEGMNAGSDPLEERTMEHESGYGGKGGEPRVSSDQRETTDEDGSLRAETNKR